MDKVCFKNPSKIQNEKPQFDNQEAKTDFNRSHYSNEQMNENIIRSFWSKK